MSKLSHSHLLSFFYLMSFLAVYTLHDSIYKQISVKFLLIYINLDAILWTKFEYVYWNVECTRNNITSDDLADGKKRNVLAKDLNKN
jgi:hypothetical protein